MGVSDGTAADWVIIAYRLCVFAEDWRVQLEWANYM